MWDNLRGTCLSLHRQVCVRCFAPFRQFVGNASVGRWYVLGLQRWFKVGRRGIGEADRGASPERVGPVRCLPASLWASGCSRTVPGRLGAGRAGAEFQCVTWADDRRTPTQLAMENLRRKTAQWFPNESRTNEGKKLVYSNSVKDILKVLDFVQLGGPEGTVLRTFRWEVLI